MKLCMIGTGYVGLVSGVCFSDLGNTVYCVDKDEDKINLLNKGNIPIYEPGLEEILKRNYKQKRLIFTSDLKKAVSNSDIIFICVGTPTKKNNNSADLKYVFSVAKDLKKLIKKYKIIVTKSTVPVSTGDQIEKIFNKLKNTKPSKAGEIHITDAIQALIKDNKKFIAHNFLGKYLDCGTMDGYVKSTLEINKS